MKGIIPILNLINIPVSVAGMLYSVKEMIRVHLFRAKILAISLKRDQYFITNGLNDRAAMPLSYGPEDFASLERELKMVLASFEKRKKLV